MSCRNLVTWYLAAMSAGRMAAAFLTRLSPKNALASSSNFGATSCLRSHHRSISRQWLSNYGDGMNQQALMESDLLVAVDFNDVVIPSDLSKRAGHTFASHSPRGVLHRAFSLFWFDANGNMLLTKRASTKITFPNVWTNACCSHPLQNMTPNEVDTVSEACPVFPGIKHAAIRKLQHELGIDPRRVEIEKVQFLGRFHYWAADTITYGQATPWGEHEVDYVLFYQSPQDVTINLNPDEVDEYKFVSIDELHSMMKEPNVLWSPWYRGILDNGGWEWWRDLEGSLDGKYTNKDILFFDPPRRHWADYNLESHDRDTGTLSLQAFGTQH